MDRGQIAELLGPEPTDPVRLRAMVRSGVLWPADERKTSGVAAIDHVLSRGQLRHRSNLSHPLVALDAVVNLDQHALMREGHWLFWEDHEWELPTGDWPDYYRPARDLAQRYFNWQEKRCQWTQDLTPWDDIVECGRALFGEREAFDVLAMVSSVVRDASQRGGDTRTYMTVRLPSSSGHATHDTAPRISRGGVSS